MWAIGCILGEILLYDRNEVVIASDPNHNKKTQLTNILNSFYYFNEKFGQIAQRDTTHGDCIDLLKKLLCYDIPNRISASDALNHPFLSNSDTTPHNIQEIRTKLNKKKYESWKVTVEEKDDRAHASMYQYMYQYLCKIN